VVLLGAKILARLLVVHGSSYVSKFASKTGGFVIMKHRFKRWWNVAPLWSICFCILFGKDVAKVDVDAPLDLFALLEAFSDGDKAKVVYPEVLPVIAAMLKAGVGTVVAGLSEDENKDTGKGKEKASALDVPKSLRTRSLSLNDQATAGSAQGEFKPVTTFICWLLIPIPCAGGKLSEKRMVELTKMLQTIIQFISHLHSTSPQFREFCVNSAFLQEMFGILFPVVCSSDHVSAETELNSRDSALTFDGGDVVIRPLISMAAPPIVRTVTVEDRPITPGGRPSTSERLRRGSSFILVTQEPTEYGPSSARLTPGIGSGLNMKVVGAGLLGYNSLVESVMELVMSVFEDMVLERRDFNGFGLNTKIPPGFQEHQIYFETYLLRNTITHIKNLISFDMKKLVETRVLTNIARFALHVTDCVYEGWFLNGAEILLDFVGTVLEYLQRPDVSKIKSVRLCAQSVTNLRSVVSRIVLFRLSELDDPKADPKHIVEFLNKMMYWQTVILSPDNTDGEFTRLICYLLYTRLIDQRHDLKVAAANVFLPLFVPDGLLIECVDATNRVGAKACRDCCAVEPSQEHGPQAAL
jgi:hypothetical protein